MGPETVGGVVFTPHALQRCQEMGVEPEALVEAFEDYTVDYPGYPSPQRLRLLRNGRLTVVYLAETPPVVMTLLHQTQEEYTRG